MEHKQYTVNKNYIHPISMDMFILALKRVNKMAEFKFLLILLNWIGTPLGIMAWVANIDSFKGWAIFILMAIYWSGVIWFSFRKKRRQERKEEMELRKQEIDLWYLEQEQKRQQSATVR